MGGWTVTGTTGAGTTAAGGATSVMWTAFMASIGKQVSVCLFTFSGVVAGGWATLGELAPRAT